MPVFDTVAQAVENHGGADRRLGRHRPPRLHQGRRLRGDRERDQADRRSSPSGSRAATSPRWSSWPTMRGARIIGPNCLGLIVPERLQDGRHRRPGQGRGQGLRARPGRGDEPLRRDDHRDLLLADPAGLGVSTAVSIGGDAIIGSTYAELMPLLRGRRADRRRSSSTPSPAAAWRPQLVRVGRRRTTRRLPIVAFMAGKFMDDEEMKGMSFGHAGTIVEGKEDTATEKIARLEAAGIRGRRADRRDPRRGQGEAGGRGMSRDAEQGLHRRRGRRLGRRRRRARREARGGLPGRHLQGRRRPASRSSRRTSTSASSASSASRPRPPGAVHVKKLYDGTELA